MLMNVRTKTYELPFSRMYVRHWGMVEAIRELIQNALDSESPFEYEFANDRLTIRSRFSRLEPRTLLLGSTSKAERTDAIGSFGEGYKIALLVLTRLGYRVNVLNGDRIWTPLFRMSRQYQEEVLHIEERPAPERNEGLTFVVWNLSPDDIARVKESCLMMQRDLGEVHAVPQGRILRDRPGKLYVGGLYICETGLKFGYDALPTHVRLERDRQTVSTFDLKWLAQQMWFDTERYDEVAALIEDDAPDMEYVEHAAPPLVKEACYRLFQKNHPGAILAKDQKDLEELVERGMTRVVVASSSGYYGCVTESNSYRNAEGRAVAVPTPEKVLADWYEAHRRDLPRAAKASFKRVLGKARDWRNK